MPCQWYESHQSLVELGRHLVHEKSFNAYELLDFFDEPWHYQDEWDQYQREAAGVVPATGTVPA